MSAIRARLLLPPSPATLPSVEKMSGSELDALVLPVPMKPRTSVGVRLADLGDERASLPVGVPQSPVAGDVAAGETRLPHNPRS